MIKSTIKKRSDHSGFLNQIKLFSGLDQGQKLKLVDGLMQVNFNKGDFVFREGDEGLEFFIIEKGEVECLQNVNGPEQFKFIRNLGSGDHFGELALINKDKRSLSIRITSESATLLTLDIDGFTRILGSIEKNLKKDYS